MFCSGGLENGGGIGRMVGYMRAAWQARAGSPPIEVVDTRGPARSPLMPFYFGGALARLLGEGIGGRGLVHVHLAGRGSTLRKVLIVGLARLLRLPIVLHLHDYDYGAFYASLPALLRRPVHGMFAAAGAVVVLGERDRGVVTDLFKVPSDRVFVVPNAAPRPPRPPLERAAPEGEAFDGAASVEFLFLGALSRRKGVHDLLQAFAPLASSPVPWRAALAGGGPEEDAFRAQARALGLSDRVAFPGWLPEAEARALLSRADVLVLPSYAEGLAMSVLEAMSFGVCIVCTPVGALGETVEDERSALMVAPGDVEGLTAALHRVLEQPDLRRRLGGGARDRFEAGFDAAAYPDRIAPAYARADPTWPECSGRAGAAPFLRTPSALRR